MDFYACLPKDYKVSVQQTLAETSQQNFEVKNSILLMDSRPPVNHP